MEYSSQKNQGPLVVIVGPTAVGKSEIAIELALVLDGEVVTADSMQVYRGLDIGTAKPSLEERRGIPHHLIDICEPNERFNVARYRDLAHETIADIHRRGKMPILAGGTGLYVKAVLDDFLFPDQGADYELRQSLERMAEEKGPIVLHQRLEAIDPPTAARLHPNDIRRVIRAIEVYETTNKPLSEHLKDAATKKPRYETVMVGLTRPRESLYRRIEKRVDQQIEDGLIDEVKGLLNRYGDLPVAQQALGYKEIAAYLKGECTLDEAIATLKRDTRHFAKRQFTWFKRDKRIAWIDLEELQGVDQAIAAIQQIIDKTFSAK